MQWPPSLQSPLDYLALIALLVVVGAILYASVTYFFSVVLSDREHRQRHLRGLLGLSLETAMAVAVFLNQGPDLLLRRRWRSREGSGTLVVLLPGYTETQFIFWYIHRRLDRVSVPYETYRFRPMLGDPRRLARDLGSYIDDLCQERGLEQVDIVGHSMGGLVGRYLLHVLEHPRVRRVVSVGSPHHGTLAAHVGTGLAARQMEPGSPLLTDLVASYRVDSRLLNIRSIHDNIVIPRQSCALDDADVVIRSGWCHLAMNFCPQVADRVIDFLRDQEGDRVSEEE